MSRNLLSSSFRINKQMKVLHLVQNYYPSLGGSQELFRRVSEGLAKNYGDDVKVFTTTALESPHIPQPQLLPKGVVRMSGVEVHRFGYAQRFVPALKFASRASGRLNMQFHESIKLLSI